jgi:hypothetical protein
MLRRRLKRFLPWIGLLGLAAALRAPLLWGLGTFWNDEAFSRHFAQKPLGELLGVLKLDVHPPLHAVILHFWMKIFGTGVAATRVLSFAFMLAGLAAFLAFARRLFGRREALLAGLLAAFSPLLVYYGADARMYAMTFFLACLSSYFLWRMIEGEERWREPWMWASMALALTHLTGAFVLIGQALFLLRAPERRPLFRKLFLRFLLIGVIFAVWLLPALSYRSRFVAREWQFRSGQEDVYAAQALVYWVWLGRNKAQLVAALAVSALLVLAGLLRRSERKPYFHWSAATELLFWWLAAVLAPFLAFPNVTPRYLIAAVPPFFLLLVRGFLRASGDRKLSLVFGAALVAFLTWPGVAVQLAGRPYQWDAVGSWVAERRAPDEPIVFGWYADRLAFEAANPEIGDDAMRELYPFDDALTDDERYVAHAGTLAVDESDLERLKPVLAGAGRFFFIPNFYVTLRSGGDAQDALNRWFEREGWFLADRMPPIGRTQGAWLMVKK